jgi:hypothetical protein
MTMTVQLACDRPMVVIQFEFADDAGHALWAETYHTPRKYAKPRVGNALKTTRLIFPRGTDLATLDLELARVLELNGKAINAPNLATVRGAVAETLRTKSFAAISGLQKQRGRRPTAKPKPAPKSKPTPAPICEKKTCSRCAETKDVSEYYGKTGARASHCKACHKAIVTAHRAQEAAA